MLPDPSAYAGATWLFVRAFGAVCAVAFVSLLVQLPGLYGSGGISPMPDAVDRLRRTGLSRWRFPSLFWWRSDDAALWTVAGVGLAASALVVVDVATIPALMVVYACYLSFATAGEKFLSYQWDALLLDTVPVALLASVASPPPLAVLLLTWFFLFRFMLSSGLAKLQSGDRTWRDLTATTYHHQTQPLPTRLAWYAHHLPRSVHRAETLAVLAIEIGVPFLLFAPDPVRLAAVAVLVLLQIVIAATGNYGFFNLQTLVLLVPFVPDRLWEAVVGGLAAPAPRELPTAAMWVVSVAAAVYAVLHLLRVATPLARFGPAARVLRALSSFRLVNRYGLFAVMTTERPELVIEASRDGETWEAYRFRWKPDDPTRPPRFNAPHQPRLDWQLWFAALGSPWNNRWMVHLLRRLLEGAEPVRRLFAATPFDDATPRYVRVAAYDYRFTDAATRRETGRWWERTRTGLYMPPMTLEDAAP